MPAKVHRCCLIAAAVLLAACTPAPERDRAGQAGEPVHIEAARSAWRIDPAQSLVVIEVRRGGPLARLGHDHVVASRDVQGMVDTKAGRAELLVPLARLRVDEPALRAEARLDTQPSADDIAGTQRNMHERVLETARYPVARIVATRGAAAATRMHVGITLHGVTRAFEVPVEIEETQRRLTAQGELAFAQSAFGITPMRVLGGALRVEDDLRLRFRIVAEAPP